MARGRHADGLICSGSYIYHHTFRMFKKQGFEAEPVDLQVSFGKGDKVSL